MLVARRAGCLGAVGSLAGWSGSRAFRRHAPLKSRRKRSGATFRVALSDTEADEDRRGEAATSMTVYVCITCKRAGDPEDGVRPGLVLARATARAAQGSGVTVRQVKCLANCSRSLSAAIRRDGAWTYVFGGLDETRDAEALIDGARLFADTSDGLMPWRGRPEILKRGLIARVPPIDFIEEETE